MRSAAVRYALAPVYWVYERLLWSSIKKGPMPTSVAVILDGNRRWALSLGLSPEQGHEAGYEKLKQVLDWMWEIGITEVTVYALSADNAKKRSKQEVDHILSLSVKGLQELAKSSDVAERRVKVRVIGDDTIFPEEVRKAIIEVEKITAGNDQRLLQIALGYGGRNEIVNTMRELARRVQLGEIVPEQIDEKLISTSLYTAGARDPDLIIRTGGEERMSDFLLWQSSYSELVFLDVYWPQFRRIDLYRAVRTYQRRSRRFGA